MIVIPARMHSTRLPRKMLLSDTGKPLIQHTYEAAIQATKPDRVVVATDHEEIESAVKQFGGTVIMTDPSAASGTDRVAEVASHFPDVSIFVNVQGDEPEIDPAAIDQAIEALESDADAVMSTLATPIDDLDQLMDPACVKVVFDGQGNALYFSRSPIPHARNGFEELLKAEPPLFHLHVGLYCYRSDFLKRLGTLEPTRFEKTECLEQLRVLENGFRIKTSVIPASSPGIDTSRDYSAFVKRYQCC